MLPRKSTTPTRAVDLSAAGKEDGVATDRQIQITDLLYIQNYFVKKKSKEASLLSGFFSDCFILQKR
jgi:hypothetical protein